MEFTSVVAKKILQTSPLSEQGNLLFGYSEEPFTLSDARRTYGEMTLMANLGLQQAKQINPNQQPLEIKIGYGIIRSRQTLYFTMPFIVRDWRIISDPNGAKILQRKVNSVLN